MSEPWEEAVKAIGIKLNAAEQELLLAKKDNATKAEITEIKNTISDLAKELAAIKKQGTEKPSKKLADNPGDITIVDDVTPDPSDILSGFW